MYERRLEIVLADQRLRDFDRRRGSHRLAIGRIDADGIGAIGQRDRLHIGDLLGSEAEEGIFRERREDGRNISLILIFNGYLLGSSVNASLSGAR